MSKLKRLGMGCAGLMLLMVGFVLLLGGVVVMAPVTEPVMRQEQRAEPLGPAEAPAPPVPSDGIALEPPAPSALGTATRHIVVDLEEGDFDVVAIDGSDVKVEATYDQTAYELTTDHEGNGSNGGVYAIRLRSTLGPFGWLGRLRAKTEIGNRVLIHVPRDVPINLTARLRKGQSRVDLSGTHLKLLDLDLAMGEHELVFGTMTVEPVERIVVELKMGDLRMEGLVNARPRELQVDAKMCDARIDLGGDWPDPDAVSFVRLRLKMGDMRAVLPEGARVVVEREEATMGEIVNRVWPQAESEPLDGAPSGPTIRLDTKVRMGELTIH